MNQEILSKINKINNVDSLTIFFDILKELIITLNISPDNERLSLNVRNDYRKRFSVVINSRLVFGIDDKSNFYVIISDEDFNKVSNVDFEKTENFDKQKPSAKLVSVSKNIFIQNKELLIRLLIKVCRDYLPVQQKSQYRIHHIPEIYDIALNEDLRKSYLRNYNPYLDLISRYKNRIKKLGLSGETYKWSLINHFQGRPNLQNPNLLEELKSIDYSNLMFHLGKGVMYHLAREKTEEYREILNNFLDESIDLDKRMLDFEKNIKSLYKQLVPNKQHHHDERTASTILTFKYPEKYTFFKNSFYKKICKLIGETPQTKGYKYSHYLSLVKNFTENYIKQDFELLDTVNSLLPEDAFKNDDYKILAQDILYQLLDKDNFDVDDDFKGYKIFNDFENWYIQKYSRNVEQQVDAMIFGFLFQVASPKHLNLLKEEDYEKYTSETLWILKREIPNFKYDELKYLDEFIDEILLLPKPFNKMKSPLNQILFGPPGTGKTYNTINKAISIANPDFDLEQDRKLIKSEYQRLVDEGKIVFTTFHQSMSYEDFIEGIKPLIPESDDAFVKYDIQDGLFKKVCTLATRKEINFDNFEDVYQKLLNEIDDSPSKSLILETLIHSKEFTIYKNSKNNIKFHANTEKAYEGVIRKDFLEHYLKTDEALDWPSYTKAISQYLVDKYNYKKVVQESELRNHVIIIDEINRGNISQIFGELITLIEEDKRLGNPESLEVTLPYSKEKFGVPPNLYIIGTMNTADRSVESLDNALRRRFSFEEMPPKYDLKELDFQIAEIPVSEILRTINLRIEKLLDKNHAIGHAYFIGKNSNGVIDSFYKNIIPLLQEYFFGDYGKIGLILGSGFVSLKQDDEEELFASFDYENGTDYLDKNSYEIMDYRKHSDNEGFENAIRKLMNSKIQVL